MHVAVRHAAARRVDRSWRPASCPPVPAGACPRDAPGRGLVGGVTVRQPVGWVGAPREVVAPVATGAPDVMVAFVRRTPGTRAALMCSWSHCPAAGQTESSSPALPGRRYRWRAVADRPQSDGGQPERFSLGGRADRVPGSEGAPGPVGIGRAGSPRRRKIHSCIYCGRGPARPRIMIRTGRDAEALVSTLRHGSLRDSRALRDHHGPRIREDRAQAWDTKKAVTHIFAGHGLDLLRARRDSNPQPSDP
jgi:hypothetical protein